MEDKRHSDKIAATKKLHKNKKKCWDCKKTKLKTSFHHANAKRGGRQGWCKKCHNKRARVWRKAHPGYHQERLKRDPNYFRRIKMRVLYGLTLEDYNHMFKKQKGVCAICKNVERRRSRSGKKTPLAVDHDHVTDIVRGLLCRPCNAMLGYLEDVGRLKKALAYLIKNSPEENIWGTSVMFRTVLKKLNQST